MNNRISVSGHSWWTIQNITWPANYNVTNVAIWLDGATHGIVQNNVLDSFVANQSDSDIMWLKQSAGLNDSIIIRNNVFGYSSISTNLQSDIIATEGSTSIIIEGNLLTMRNPDENSHNDIVQTFCGNNCTGKTPPADWIIRYNKFVMDTTSSHNKSFTMVEGMTGTMEIYGNLFLGLSGAGSANGVSLSGPAIFNVYNNTFVAKGSSVNHLVSSGNLVYLKNNIAYAAGNQTLLKYATPNRDHNLWFGTNIPSCLGYVGEICQQDPLFTDFNGDNFSIQLNSPAQDTGVNLGVLYNQYILPGSTWPNPTLRTRPATGPWDIGAYEFASGGTLPPPDTTPPSAPTGVSVN